MSHHPAYATSPDINMTELFIAKWAILGCGWISNHFVNDLRLSPSSRGITGVSHAIVAVGARSLANAEDFISRSCPRGGAAQEAGLVNCTPKAYGSYQEAMNDPNVSVIYIGTINTSHFDLAHFALEHGKNCLVEKPACLNSAEWTMLSRLAKEKELFLMEGVWTRFNPVLLAVEEAVHRGDIGDIRCLYSDYAMDVFGKQPDTSRFLSAELAGGALLDIGPYPMVWALTMLYRHPLNQITQPGVIGTTMLLHTTGVDLATSITMTFERLKAVAFCTVNLLSATNKAQHTRIVGSKGEIIVQGYTSRPRSYLVRKLIDATQEGGDFHPDEVFDMPFGGYGLHYEADAVAECLKFGLKESPRMLHAETLMTMQIYDEARRKGRYILPSGLEKVSLGE
ncbi:hypothetical protein BCR39DRAFT_539672 [Naematelia encephala]|uniref:D-xylose 1-dehydrogenase (NADP(+), D-xylono-1,5-lactone-forming) n=1 Tax=Naematelia encephala TaxID=71784 RepID=A0A1Y2AWL7_9TREE|nr:hypothetical protein BCR39DRAFT_539672 [Naematelia encephala]